MAPAYFDAGRGVLDAGVFSRPAIYRDELASIFNRNWLFLGPVDWAEADGAFFTTTMGETPVLVWRTDDGPRAFVNRCLGSDRLLSDARRGVADVLRCPCHGWVYAASGAPGTALPDAVPGLAVHAGLVFGCLDADAPDFAAATAPFALYLDAIVRSLSGGIAVIGGAPLVTRLDANWKLGAEAHSGDLYRDATLGQAAREALGDAAQTHATGFQAATEAGAVVMADGAGDGVGEDPLAGMRPVTATLFPNLSYDGRGHALHVWQPRGPEVSEVWTYPLAGRAESEAVQDRRRRACQLRFGPMGFETEDHAAVWASITAASRGLIAGAQPLNLQMGLGRERASNLPGRIADVVSESNQRQFYAWWSGALARGPLPAPARRLLRLIRPDSN